MAGQQDGQSFGGDVESMSGGSVDTAPASRCHCDSRAPQEGGRVQSCKSKIRIFVKTSKRQQG